MNKQRQEACIKINAITNKLDNLRQRTLYDGLPLHQISQEMRDISIELGELFWAVDGIETAEDFAEKMVRLANEVRRH